MPEPMSEKHYEEDFQYPLWKLIKQRAEEKDISYLDATLEVCPEYKKTMRYGDTEFEKAAIQKGLDDAAEVVRRWEKRNEWLGKGAQ